MKDEIIYSNTWNDHNILDAKNLLGPILIIGASGFIGANLFYSLTKYRDDVFACSRNPRNSWRLAAVSSAKLIAVDITNHDKIKDVIHFIKPRTIFNLSAYGGYERQNNITLIHRTNYIGTLNLLRVLAEIGCDAFVQAGTSSEYGLNCISPAEDEELIPNSDYAVSKVGAAYLVKYYGKIYQFPCVNLRLYSVYGSWEERDRLIPVLIANGLQGRFPYFVNKKISRDFVYIDDCTNALVRACLTTCKTNPGISLNIASGIKTTLQDVAKIAKELFQIPAIPIFGSMPNRKWDLQDWYGDNRAAFKIMRWKYSIPFAEGLRLTSAWEKEYQIKLKYVFVPTKQKKISVIIACYKDHLSIPILHDRLTKVFQQTGYDYEIIFVNDNSPENDEDVIVDLCKMDAHVIGISHSRNFGSQSTFVSGLEIATGDAAVLMAGDGQDPPEIIPNFIKQWEEGYEIIYGERIKRETTFYMQFLYKLFYRIFAKLSDVNIPLDAGDFSLIDRKAINHLLKFTEKDIFLRGLRAWMGYKQIGVPYHRPERLFGKSTNNLRKNIWWAKKAIFSFSMRPLSYIQSLGILIFFVTSLLIVFYLVKYFINPPQNARGIPTIILLVLGLGSIQLISVSILGDYISKIIEEVKNRPRYIRNKIFYNGEIFATEDEMLRIIEELKRMREMSS